MKVATLFHKISVTALLICSVFLCIYSAAAEESSVVNRRDFLVQGAREAIEGRKPFVALRQLSLLSADVQDEEVLGVVRDALTQLHDNLEQIETTVESRTALEDASTQELISRFLLVTPDFEERYTDILIARAYSLAALGRHESLVGIYQQITDRVPATMKLRDEVAYKIAEVATGDVKTEFAPLVLQDLAARGSLSFFDRFHFFMLGYYVGITGRNLILAVSIILFIVIGYFVVKTWEPHRWILQQLTGKKKNKVPTAEDLVSEDDNYSRMLKVLGLDDTANEETIKQAYRQLIKDLHPDSSKGQADPESLKRFRDVQNAYKRIKEMRAGWFS